MSVNARSRGVNLEPRVPFPLPLELSSVCWLSCLLSCEALWSLSNTLWWTYHITSYYIILHHITSYKPISPIIVKCSVHNNVITSLKANKWILTGPPLKNNFVIDNFLDIYPTILCKWWLQLLYSTVYDAQTLLNLTDRCPGFLVCSNGKALYTTSSLSMSETR